VNWLTDAAEIAGIIGGGATAVAAITWIGIRLNRWRAAANAKKDLRNWGFIDPSGIGTWYVRCHPIDPECPSQVVLDVCDSREGDLSPMLAQAIRISVSNDGTLSRSPTPAEWEFLTDLRKERFNSPNGIFVR